MKPGRSKVTCTSPSSNLDYQDDSGEDNDHDDGDDGDCFFFLPTRK